MNDREKWLQNWVDYGTCARCGHFKVSHRMRCQGLVEGENDRAAECDCPEFVQPPEAEH